MARRLVLERVLRDDDDASGQSIRQWRVEMEDEKHIKIRACEGAEPISIRVEDIEQFSEDLMALAGA